MKETRDVLSADPLQIGPAPLQLDGYYVKELHCSVRNDLDEQSHFAVGTGLHIQHHSVMVCPAPSFDIDIGVSEHLKDKQRFRIVLEIFSDEEEEDSPYDFDISLVGFFSVTGVDMLKEQIPLYYRNGVMILYSAAREIIAATTARGPFPAFILPTMTFDLSNRTWVKMAKAEAKARELIEQKKTRQLPSAVKKPAKKKASKRGAKI